MPLSWRQGSLFCWPSYRFGTHGLNLMRLQDFWSKESGRNVKVFGSKGNSSHLRSRFVKTRSSIIMFQWKTGPWKMSKQSRKILILSFSTSLIGERPHFWKFTAGTHLRRWFSFFKEVSFRFHVMPPPFVSPFFLVVGRPVPPISQCLGRWT